MKAGPCAPTAARSQGMSVRRSMTSQLMPSASATSAAWYKITNSCHITGDNSQAARTPGQKDNGS